MKTREEIEKRHKEELAALELEQKLSALLPIQPNQFTGPTWKAPYLTYRKKDSYPRETYTLKEAINEVLTPFLPYLTEFEIRKDNCTSINPAEIQQYKNGRLITDGVTVLNLDGGKGYSHTELEFWVRISGHYFKIQIEIQRKSTWHPHMRRENAYAGKRDETRKSGPYIITPADIKADHQIKYAPVDRMEPQYNIVYTWQNIDSFLSWAEVQEDRNR